MATVLRVSRGDIRRSCRAWLWQLALSLALACVLVVGTVERAHAASPVTTTIATTINGVTTRSVGSVLNADGSQVMQLAWNGATMATPIGRGIGIAASILAPIAAQKVMDMAKGGSLSDPWAGIAGQMSGKTTCDAVNGCRTKNDASGRQPYPASKNYAAQYVGSGSATARFPDPVSACTSAAAASAAAQGGRVYEYASYIEGSSAVQCIVNWTNANPPRTNLNLGGVVQLASGCGSGDVLTNGTCYPAGWTDPGTREATVAEVSDAFSKIPSVFPDMFKAFNCAPNGSMSATFTDTPGAGQECKQIMAGADYKDPWFPQGNKVTFPPDVQTTRTVDASGNPTTRVDTVTQTVTLTANTGTDKRTNPVLATSETTTTTTTTDANGNTSTTTTTVTSGAQTPTKENEADTAAFHPPEGELYTKKTKTFADVLSAFQARLMAAPWMLAVKSFFVVSVGSGNCPSWVVPASAWTPVLDATPYFCGSTAMTLYHLGGAIVLAVAAWAAFRIAFL